MRVQELEREINLVGYGLWQIDENREKCEEKSKVLCRGPAQRDIYLAS